MSQEPIPPDFHTESGKYPSKAELSFLQKYGDRTVTLYRAISIPKDNGVPNFFTSNKSPAQHGNDSEAGAVPDEWYGNDLFWSAAMTFVPGLPVFLDKQTAIRWGTGVTGKHNFYLTTMEIPLKELRGVNSEVKVMMNNLQSPGKTAIHTELTSWDLLGVESDPDKEDKLFITSECYIRARGENPNIPSDQHQRWKQGAKLMRQEEYHPNKRPTLE